MSAEITLSLSDWLVIAGYVALMFAIQIILHRRPRLFARDGLVYLLGRNWTKAASVPGTAPRDGGPSFPAAMKLCLFRFGPTSLAITAYAVIDNAEGANVTDGYYAAPYFREVDGRTYFNVITYKGLDRRPPQIVELEYHWDELR